MRQAEIDRQNQWLIDRRNQFRAGADVVTAAWAAFPEVVAVALTGSVAKPLWKEVPRFAPFRRKGIALWHECMDIDLVLWLDSQERLGELRRAKDTALREAFAAIGGLATHGVDTFLFEPGSDRYLGRLCHFAQCPKGKPDCRTPGCGATAFNKVVPGFTLHRDLLAAARVLYRRDAGVVLRAVDLPTEEAEGAG
ncbi:hypothetical protein [Caenispirillum bisanense]|uniref:Uncharacterized protein n=1 Tax=Caenispirillum bisanense TaxID=414052 RepID=A0A286G2X0_9PROT|nr:hypothetical protein [Caenispirillum bisanense]SOD89861.1 hypothetical protein SAMN05421508_101360 [Caenispirillum bisanense]